MHTVASEFVREKHHAAHFTAGQEVGSLLSKVLAIAAAFRVSSLMGSTGCAALSVPTNPHVEVNPRGNLVESHRLEVQAWSPGETPRVAST